MGLVELGLVRRKQLTRADHNPYTGGMVVRFSPELEQKSPALHSRRTVAQSR
jgi:hypothetical protein